MPDPKERRLRGSRHHYGAERLYRAYVAVMLLAAVYGVATLLDLWSALYA